MTMDHVQVNHWCRTSYLWRGTLRLGLIYFVATCGLNVNLYAQPSHSFSVQDSIERTTFSDPDGRVSSAPCKHSPDGRYFFAITTKGVLADNKLNSTILLYSVHRVAAFVNGKNGIAPAPRQLWKMTAVPRAQQSDSYGSLITKARWSSDSSAILFLAEMGDGARRLYKIDIHHGRAVLLSKKDADIQDFSEASGTVAYTSQPEVPGTSLTGLAAQNHAISTVLTGSTVFNIFDHRHFPVAGSLERPTDLWAMHKGRNIQLNSSSGDEQWQYPASAGRFRLAVSPDGTALIAARSPHQIPDTWRSYRSTLPSFNFKKLPATEANPSGDRQWPWQYIYIRLDHQMTTALVDAPSASGAGYGDAVQASWSSDGNQVLFTNTFLPTTTESNSSQRDVPCVAAVFRVDTKKTQCIAYTRYPTVSARLRSARFGPTPSEVLLEWSQGNRRTTETYRKDSTQWTLIGASTHEREPDERLTISVIQDLNELPTLWVRDSETGQSKQLWNPNPQLALAQRGEVSIYQWKDATGYEWTAGLVKPFGYQLGHHYPLVIQTHGFNEHEFLVDGSYTTGYAAQPLASTGIMVLQMPDRKDRHLKPVSEEATLFADGCAAAIDKLARDGLIDPAKVGVIGFSRTSWYVEATLERYADIFRASSLIDGIDQGYVSYILFCPGLASCKEDHESANRGSPFGQNLSRWLSSSPGFNLEKIKAPVRIEAIGWYSLLQEWQLYSALTLQDKPVDLIYIPDGQHILQQPQQRYASQQGTVEWFRFWLQDYEDPDPRKAAQYSRWRRLRSLQTINLQGVGAAAQK